MGEYHTSVNGELIPVYDLDACIKAIKQRHEDNESRIQFLEEENAKLKEEAYKDNELKKMKARLEKAEKEILRGFRISEEEERAIDEWIKKHEIKKHKLVTPFLQMKAQGVSGGRYSYHFVPTALGTSGVVRCVCGAEFEFSELD